MQNERIKMIQNKKDAIIFLNQLIIIIDKRMTRFKNGIRDLEKELSKYNKSDKIATEIFNMHSERIGDLTNYLLNLFGDETKTAVSYKQFRNIVDKRAKSGQSDIQLDELEEDIAKLLNEFRNMRNWTHHCPQSLFNSQIDYLKNVEGIPPKLVEYQFSQLEVYVLTWEYHEFNWMEELYENSNEYYKKFSKVFQRIKKDYSKLIGKNVMIIREKQEDPRPHEFYEIAEKSYNINTGKKPNSGK